MWSSPRSLSPASRGWNGVNRSSEDPSWELVSAVITEKAFPIAKEAIERGLSRAKNDGKNIKWSFIELTNVELDHKKLCSMIMEKKPSLVINTVRTPGSNYYKLTMTIKEVLKNLGMPTLDLSYGISDEYSMSGWSTKKGDQGNYLIHVTPPGDSYTQAVRELSLKMDLATAGILYDKTVLIDHKYARLLENVPTRHIMREVGESAADFWNKTQVIQSTDVSNYFVVGSISHLSNALEVAKKYDLRQRHHCWVLVTKQEGEPSCDGCTNLEALFVHPVKVDDTRVGKEGPYGADKLDGLFYEEISEYTVKRIFATEKYSKEPIVATCPGVGSARPNNNLYAALNSAKLKGIYGDVVFDMKVGYQQIRMKVEHLNFTTAKNRDTQDKGYFTYQGDANVAVWKEGQSSLEQYGAVTFYKVVTIVQPPFVYRNNETKKFRGYCIDLIDEIKKILKFEYEIYEVADSHFGSKNKEGTWSGLIGDLVQKKADIALGPIAVMAERETVVDFTVPYYDLVGLSILMKKPEVKPSLFKFLTVLETNVWGCILAAYFFTSFLMFIFDRLSPYSYRNNKEKYKDDDEKREFTLKECLWFCMTSLTPQGGGEAPRNLSGRLVAATWWLFGFIIIASYTANLAAFLTVSRLESPIESLDDLSKQYKVKYAPQKDTTASTYFQRMANIEEKFYEIWKNMSLDDSLTDDQRAELAVWDYPVSDKFTKIWWTMQEANLPESFEAGVQRVKDSLTSEGFAFIADATQIKYATMTNCDLTQIGSEFSRKPLALAVQQNSPLRDQLSSAILKLLNQRRLESLKETWWNQNSEKKECDEEGKNNDGISIKNIGGVFIVIFIGVVMACITLVFEYFWYKNKKPRSKVVSVKEHMPQKR
ncbi:ionotropic receptor 25a [Galendromus occidentalis]|uniref:Ionotropic receptor 25a n=1 Tax=Galendromus occidentalis TaxID=34638 RepID=A0AAJ6QTP0_9ACAR|nr:ionotropic receptor 25a [Galendromus occidentalis]